jgi:hypothetical protein
MEQGRTFRVTVPKFPTKDANHRILARQKSRFTHNYFYIRDEVLGPLLSGSAVGGTERSKRTNDARAQETRSVD